MDTRERADQTTDNDDEQPAERSALGLGGFTFVGLDRKQTAQALARFTAKAIQRPGAIASRTLAFGAEQVRILTGNSSISPDPKDRRFADPEWRKPGWRQLVQSYLAFRDAVQGSVDEVDLDGGSRERARFGLMQITEALAPSNNLLTNPVALRTARRTRGASLAAGARHLTHDIRHNHGLPSQVDTRPFAVGKNIAATPGLVVKRTDQFELIHYRPSTAKVHSRPLVIIPPQINRYYFLDLAPGRSFAEFAVANELQVFMISWRNPQPEHRHWSLDTYVTAIIEALETVTEITGSDDANTIGFCSGGMTQSILLGYLSATGRPLVNAAALGVTMVDTHVQSTINSFATRRSVQSTIDRSRKAGGVRGDELARIFAWIRPNDLIWNYWVSNYLLGENPPAFDVLAWNSDATNLPNQIHEQFLDISLGNLLMEPGAVSTLGHSVDLRDVDVDHYSVGAVTDHLVPWQACYRATQLFGGNQRFVLSNSGHIQALVNPPTNPKASYFVNEDLSGTAEEWLAGAQQVKGSWWTDWAAWIRPRSGTLKKAPSDLGSAQNPPICAAPGTYVTS